jgi:hypothetical protein
MDDLYKSSQWVPTVYQQMGHALECFLFMFSLVLLACRREGSTHDDTQEDVIMTAVRPLLSLYGVSRQDVGVVECLFFL